MIRAVGMRQLEITHTGWGWILRDPSKSVWCGYLGIEFLHFHPTAMFSWLTYKIFARLLFYRRQF